MILILVLTLSPGLVSAQGCFTVGGNSAGSPCILPFIYNGVLREGCITDNDPDLKPWCSTQTNQTNHHITGNWGHCSLDCIQDGACQTSLGAPGTCMPANQCIGVDLYYLQENVCPETKNLVCCSGVESNLQIEFSAAEISESNPLSTLEEDQLQALFSELELETEAEDGQSEESEPPTIGVRFGGGQVHSSRRSVSLHNRFNKPRRESKLLDKTSNLLLKVASKLENSGIGLRSGLDAFSSSTLRNNCPWIPAPNCPPGARYRTPDGTCNNLKNPNYGRTGTPFQRILLPTYGKGSVDAPRRRPRDGFELPSAREISNGVTGKINDLDSENTLLLMQLGQFIDHDLTHTPAHDSGSCCKSGGRFPSRYDADKCFPIRVARNDEFWGGILQCMEFSRSLSSPDLNCKLQHREQLNQVSHWLDGSNIYGSTEEESSMLRSTGGFMKVSGQGRNNLPSCGRNTQELDACSSCDEDTEEKCFFAGDFRVNEQPNLIVIHTVFLREHNRIVGILSELNPTWDGERLYQEARRITVAHYQHIVYHEWLPIVLGKNMMKSFGLLTLSSGYSTDYSDSFDPRINNEFASAAFRFGHSLITGDFAMKPTKGSQGSFSLREMFFNPMDMNSSNTFDGLVRGLTEEETRAWDSNFVEDVRNHLFEESKDGGGFDLVAINIQRGRDHGVPGYTKYLEICGGTNVQDWEDLRGLMKPEHISRLQKAYRSVEDVDLFVGGFLEDAHEDSMIGPVFKCIIGDQFARLKKGDRFFYDLGTDPNSRFSELQLKEIRKVSLGRILCENTELDSIQPFPLKMPINEINSKRSCEELMSFKINWNVFKE